MTTAPPQFTEKSHLCGRLGNMCVTNALSAMTYNVDFVVSRKAAGGDHLLPNRGHLLGVGGIMPSSDSNTPISLI